MGAHAFDDEEATWVSFIHLESNPAASTGGGATLKLAAVFSGPCTGGIVASVAFAFALALLLPLLCTVWRRFSWSCTSWCSTFSGVTLFIVIAPRPFLDPYRARAAGLYSG